MTISKSITNQELITEITSFIRHSNGNYISASDAIYPELAGMKLYEDPLVGFADACDELFTTTFKQESVIHPDFKAPQEWLPGARTVISFFVPFTEPIRFSNRKRFDEPYTPDIPQHCSAAWLHGRIEGQAFMNQITDHIEEVLRAAGYHTMCPSSSGKLGRPKPYVTDWSERHVAYAAGLGTFGLSKGLITAKGMAGRFGSVITDAPFLPTPRPYSSPFEYCTMCGACQVRCPVAAIDKTKGCANGKDQTICGPYVNGGKLPPHGPKQLVRYGCGKCQVGVPCETGIPARTALSPII